MATNRERSTAVGVFHDHQLAGRAVGDLRQAGFDEDRIGIASRYDEAAHQATPESADSRAGEGAAAGAAAGAGVGALWGIGIVTGTLPVLGPAIAGGALASILSSAVAGAAVTGIAGALIGLGIPKEEAEYYETEFKEGRTIVTVDAGDRYREALAILESHGARTATPATSGRAR